MARNHVAEAVTKLPQLLMIDGEAPLPASDDGSAIRVRIQSTHSFDGRMVDVKTIYEVIRDILHQADQSMDSVSSKSGVVDTFAGMTSRDGGKLKEYASTINQISCELSCKRSGGADSDSTTFDIFNNLSNYFWDAKVMIALAALAVNYVEFCLISQLSTTNSLANFVSPFRFPGFTAAPPSCFANIEVLLHAILNVTECILKFKELISHETLAVDMANDFSVAAYWTIRSMVICSSLITYAGITPTEEVQGFIIKLENIRNNFNSQLEEIRYRDLIRIFYKPEADTITIIGPLICIKEDKSQPLLYGTTSTNRVGFKEVLKAKTVVFLISDLDIVKEELFALQQSYDEKNKVSDLNYEIVWIPVVEKSTTPSNDASQEKFKTKMHELMMPWYIVADPWSLDPVLIRYVKEEWSFSKKLILVVVDTQGKVVCKNALNMFMIWGNFAYPFTTAKEESLWEKETWTLDLLVKRVDQSIVEPTSNNVEFICLYGGLDTEWIRQFITAAEKVAKTAGITSMKMVYAGKRKAKEQEIKKITAAIEAGDIPVLPDDVLPGQRQTYFWTRFESMWNSRVQHIDRKTAKDDRILREASMMLSFGESDKGWAVIWERSTTEMAIANGNIILEVLLNFQLSAEDIKKKGLVPALNEDIVRYRQQNHHQYYHCNKIMIPWEGAKIAENWPCADCGRPMEMYFMYRCCTD